MYSTAPRARSLVSSSSSALKPNHRRHICSPASPFINPDPDKATAPTGLGQHVRSGSRRPQPCWRAGRQSTPSHQLFPPGLGFQHDGREKPPGGAPAPAPRQEGTGGISRPGEQHEDFACCSGKRQGPAHTFAPWIAQSSPGPRTLGLPGTGHPRGCRDGCRVGAQLWLPSETSGVTPRGPCTRPARRSILRLAHSQHLLHAFPPSLVQLRSPQATLPTPCVLSRLHQHKPQHPEHAPPPCAHTPGHPRCTLAHLRYSVHPPPVHAPPLHSRARLPGDGQPSEEIPEVPGATPTLRHAP